MYHQVTDLADQASNLLDRIYALNAVISSLATTTENQTYKDHLQGGASLILDDLAAETEALLSDVDKMRVNFPEG